MDAEQIARDCVKSQCGSDDLCRVLDEKSCGCVAMIATALRSAYSAGYAAAREQAAGVILTQCHDDMTRDEEATAIRAMEPPK